MKPERGRTLAVGAVLDLSKHGGPRFSADYSRITTHGEIRPFPLTARELVAAEATYPDRVVRAPLTAADVQRGFSGGRILLLDTGAINAGRTTGETVDFEFAWSAPASRAGDFRTYARATWQPSFRRKTAASLTAVNRVGYADGLLAWRGNAGIAWTSGPLTLDLNAQYFHRYRVTHIETRAAQDEQIVRFQGSRRIPGQIYFDLAATRRFELRSGAGPLTALEVRFGIQNLFDRRPPIDANLDDERYYSPYGDPRGRGRKWRFPRNSDAPFRIAPPPETATRADCTTEAISRDRRYSGWRIKHQSRYTLKASDQGASRRQDSR